MQKAGAIAVIVHDNIYEGFIHMANDNTQEQPTIPAIFITKSEGNYLMQLLVSANQGSTGLANEDSVVQVYLGPNNENNMRLTINSVMDQPDGTHTVKATMEIRRTAAGHAGLSYAKYSMRGTEDPTTRLLALEPEEWISNPGDMEWLGVRGTISDSSPGKNDARFLKGIEMPPFKLHFQAQQRPETGCGTVLKSVSDCAMTDTHGYCGQGCLKAVDTTGYRVFNDEGCEFGEPLLYYCKLTPTPPHCNAL